MRWSTVSTDRSPAIASTASLIARTAPLRASFIDGHDTAGRGAPHRVLALGRSRPGHPAPADQRERETEGHDDPAGDPGQWPATPVAPGLVRGEGLLLGGAGRP